MVQRHLHERLSTVGEETPRQGKGGVERGNYLVFRALAGTQG